MAANRRKLLALSGAVLASLSGCLADFPPGLENGNEKESNPASSELRDDPDVDANTMDTLVAGNTEFAFDIYDRLLEDEPKTDHFLSPFSISMALAMTWAGARGDTEEAMADTLNFSLDQDDLHPAFNALDLELDERSDIEGNEDNEGGDPFELNIANALWPREGLDLREEYIDTMEAQYGALPVEVDYSDPEQASEIINDWVADETEERIDDLVSEGDLAQNPPLVLTNAIYFLAGWLEEFDEEDTYNAEFTTLDGSTGEVSMMSQTESFPYAAVDGHQIIELPYVGEETSMVVILPADEEFETFESELDADRLDTLLAQLDTEYGTIELPRFELETSYGLPEMLEDLGMEVAFTSDADFSGMVDGGGLWIDNVLHDAFVAVDEEGTEAAAATAVIMGDSGPPPEEFEMIVDRPFLFLIRDRPTDAVLFLGRVVDTPDDPN